MEDVRRRCLLQTDGDVAKVAGVVVSDKIVLSGFPDQEQLLRLMDKRNRCAIAKADQISIGEKRNCFLALRLQDSDIHPSSMFSPLGITVGELVVSQVLSTGTDRVRKD
jgi:hypothetical protein